jgi:hypothetical protein
MRHSMAALGMFAAAAMLALLTLARVEVPLPISAILMAASLVFATVSCLKQRIGPITLLAHVILCLPFIHLAPYLIEPPPPNTPLLWGLVPNPYMFDMDTIRLTATLGAVGSCAMAGGFLATSGYFNGFRLAGATQIGNARTMPLWLTVLAVAVALTLAVVSAPRNTIFEAIYTGEGSLADRINFNSAWLVSCAILLLVFADGFIDPLLARSRIKVAITLVASLYFVLWLQFARGDRETLFFVFAVGYLIFVWGAPHLTRSSNTRAVMRSLSVVGVLVTLAAGVAIQKYRYELAPNAASLPKPPEDRLPTAAHSASSPSPGASSPSAPAQPAAPRVPGTMFKSIDMSIPSGTWSGVLLTTLSIAGDEVRGTLGRAWGRTYLNLVLSMPPGFLADWIGYKRPIDAKNGPAHTYKYGIGGSHAVVVPMMNFGILGVLFILTLAGLFVGLAEKRSSDPAANPKLAGGIFLQGMLITILPQWLWYGEKNFLTAATLWAILFALYALLINWMPHPRIEEAAGRRFDAHDSGAIGARSNGR